MLNGGAAYPCKNPDKEKPEGFRSEIEKANNEYYISDSPHLTDSQYDVIVKLLRITLKTNKVWTHYLKMIERVGAKPAQHRVARHDDRARLDTGQYCVERLAKPQRMHLGGCLGAAAQRRQEPALGNPVRFEPHLLVARLLTGARGPPSSVEVAQVDVVILTGADRPDERVIVVVDPVRVAVVEVDDPRVVRRRIRRRRQVRHAP